MDTSSVVQIRRMPNITTAQAGSIYARLEIQAHEGGLLFPRQVLEELSRFSILPKKAADLPLQWAKRVAEDALRIRPSFEAVREVLERVPSVLDSAKPDATDEADPYVLALALELSREGTRVRVVTEERVDNPLKMSMATAAGILELPCVPVYGLLALLGIQVE
jgi:hypothetical protein